MDPQHVWCPNVACPARGQVGQGTIGVHSQQERRYRCSVCGKTFAARTGTIFHRRRAEADQVQSPDRQQPHLAHDGHPESCVTRADARGACN